MLAMRAMFVSLQKNENVFEFVLIPVEIPHRTMVNCTEYANYDQ